MNKEIKILIILTFSFLVSCRDHRGGNNKIISESILYLFQGNDSLSKVFIIDKFKSSIDTLNFIVKAPPTQVSLIEYYGASSYTVSHMKILLLLYENKGSIYLFKYDNKSNAWKLAKYSEVATERLKYLQNKIVTNSDWVKKRDYKSIKTTGDILRYWFYTKGFKKSKHEIAYSPSAELTDLVGSCFN